MCGVCVLRCVVFCSVVLCRVCMCVVLCLLSCASASRGLHPVRRNGPSRHAKRAHRAPPLQEHGARCCASDRDEKGLPSQENVSISLPIFIIFALISGYLDTLYFPHMCIVATAHAVTCCMVVSFQGRHFIYNFHRDKYHDLVGMACTYRGSPAHKLTQRLWLQWHTVPRSKSQIHSALGYPNQFPRQFGGWI